MAKKKTNLSNAWNTVTPLSKMLAASLFILVPIAAFYLGIYYEQQTRGGFPNFTCKKWDTVCDPNLADPHGKCAPKTVCVDPSPSPTSNK